MTDLIKKIEQKTGIPDIVQLLAGNLSGSELNSLLMEVFNETLKKASPASLLKKYSDNQFAQPADTDMIGLLSAELETLQFLQRCHFQPVELSPVSQFGSCAVVGTVDQKKIISALRNTEVMADATNALALHIAGIKRSGAGSGLLRFCTVHRHLRSQPFKAAGFTPHFKVGCLVTSGRDNGDYQFECINLHHQIQTLIDLLEGVYRVNNISIRLLKRTGYDHPDRMFRQVLNYLQINIPGCQIGIDETMAVNNYYKGIQFKVTVVINEQPVEIADGGFVDWTQQLLENKKERLLIAGFGLSLLYKLLN